MSSRSLEYWRDYFTISGASSNIFEIIDGAIMVAAADHPEEFVLRRCSIAKLLSSPYVDKVEAKKSKEIEVVNNDHAEMNVDNNNNNNHNVRDDEAEELNDQIEYESECMMEVLRIRDILLNYREQSHSELHEALRKLQLMNLTLDLLQESKIVKAVSLLIKHQSKDIAELAETLTEEWQKYADEWFKVDTPITSISSENPPLDDEGGLPSPPMDEGALFSFQPISMEPSKFFDGLDDDGNPIQNDEFTRTRKEGRSQNMMPKRKSQSSNEANTIAKDTKIMQEKKNKASNEANMVAKDNKIEPKKKNKAPNEANMVAKDNKIEQKRRNKASNEANMVAKNTEIEQKKKNKAPNEANIVAKENKIEQRKKNNAAMAVRLNKPLTAGAHSNLERPSKSTMQKRDNIEPEMVKKSILKAAIRDNIEPEMHKNTLKGAIQRRPQVDQSDQLKLDADALEEKFQASKRKLQDHYLKAQAAKKLRTAQYVEFHDLPKEEPRRRIPSAKSKSRKRPGAGGRKFIQE